MRGGRSEKTVDRSRLRAHLRPDEKILWSNKPEKTPFIFSSLLVVPMAISTILFSVFWYTFVKDDLGRVVGLFPLLFGIGQLVYAPTQRLLSFKNTEYLITDRRVMTLTGAVGLRTEFVDLERIQRIYVRVGVVDERHGTGTLLIRTAASFDSGPELRSIREPYEVQKLLENAVEELSRKKLQINRCPSCGAEVDEQDHFCDICGTTLD